MPPVIPIIGSSPRDSRRTWKPHRQQNQKRESIEVDQNAFTNLADDLSAAWNAPSVSMRARQQLLRALIIDIIVNVDDEARDVVLTIHWRGWQHSQLRVRKRWRTRLRHIRRRVGGDAQHGWALV
jgi:hypothetical protein